MLLWGELSLVGVCCHGDSDRESILFTSRRCNLRLHQLSRFCVLRARPTNGFTVYLRHCDASSSLVLRFSELRNSSCLPPSGGLLYGLRTGLWIGVTYISSQIM